MAESTHVINGSSGVGTAVMDTAQRAADRLPDAVAGVHTAATGTQRWLDGMPDDGLVIGSSFSLGMGVALFLSGSSRLFVIAALVPAAAMLLTIAGRNRASKPLLKK